MRGGRPADRGFPGFPPPGARPPVSGLILQEQGLLPCSRPQQPARAPRGCGPPAAGVSESTWSLRPDRQAGPATTAVLPVWAPGRRAQRHTLEAAHGAGPRAPGSSPPPRALFTCPEEEPAHPAHPPLFPGPWGRGRPGSCPCRPLGPRWSLSAPSKVRDQPWKGMTLSPKCALWSWRPANRVVLWATSPPGPHGGAGPDHRRHSWVPGSWLGEGPVRLQAPSFWGGGWGDPESGGFRVSQEGADPE